jgi:hypothetical protein
MDGQHNAWVYSIAPMAGLAPFARELSLTLSAGNSAPPRATPLPSWACARPMVHISGTQSFVDERAAAASSGLEAHRGPAPAPSPNPGPSPARSDRFDRGEPARARDQADELGTLPDAVSGRSRI